MGRCPAPLPHLVLLGVGQPPLPPDQWRTEGGGQGGGDGPRAQALEGALGQLVGANFKNCIAVARINLVAKVAYYGPRAPDMHYRGSFYLFVLKTFFCLSILFPCRGGCRIYQTGGGAPSPKGASRVGICGGGGGGGRRSKHWPPGAGDPRYATAPDLAVLPIS